MHGLLRRRSVALLSVPLLLVALGATAPAARGDEIDKDMAKEGPDLVELLRSRPYKNVGVLPFQIRRAGGPVNMHVGRLNGLLATRLENVLILELGNRKEKRPGVVCGAGNVAAKNPDATYLTAAGRAALFQGKYPLAWGKQDVEVDAFLTGELHYARDMKTATVVLQLFDKKHPERLEVVASFKTRTTLGMLGDMGVDYVVRGLAAGPKKVAPPAAAPKLPDVATFQLSEEQADKLLPPATVAKADPAPKPKPKAPEPLPSVKDVLTFKIFYDNEPQGELDSNPRPPKLGQQVHFEIVNHSDKPLGMVLRVNGVNTADSDRQVKDFDKYARWILAPKQPYTIYGFYSFRKKVKPGEDNAICEPFKASHIGQVHKNPELAVVSKLGQIDLDVFVASSETPRVPDGLRCLSEPAVPVATFSDLRKRVVAAEARAIVVPAEGSRELILPDPKNAKRQRIGIQRFTGQPYAHRTIDYDRSALLPKKDAPK